MEFTPLRKKKSNNKNKFKLKVKNKKNLKQKKYKTKTIFKFIIIFTFIISDISFFPFEIINSWLFNETKAFQEILSFEKNINITDDTFYEFFEINNQNKLIEENIKFEKVKNPIISVVMTVYNQAYCLHRCLRSIQNQSLKNIEIIIVDDCSLDNSVELIKEYQKEDPRIILIEHDANRGTIKTRTDGVKKAKGKYIASIDGDDALLHKDILKNSLYIAEKGNLDIVEFLKYINRMGRFSEKFYNYPNIKLDYIIHQPELRNKFIPNNRFNYSIYYLKNRNIIGKLIKRKLYKKAIKYVGKEYTEDYIVQQEDTIFAITFFHLAKSYYLMKQIGYLYFVYKKFKYLPNEKSKVCKAIDQLKDFDWFKYTKFLVENTGNNFKEQMVAYKRLMSLDFLDQIDNKKLDDRHYKIMLKILDKSLTFEFLSEDKKDYIIEIKNEVLKRKKSHKID